jgi:hypothetical protein
MKYRLQLFGAAVFAGLYVVAPFFAGLAGAFDKRGPRIFAVSHHKTLYNIGYSVAGRGRAAEPFTERVWFYGQQPKPSGRWETVFAVNRFAESVGMKAFARYKAILQSKSIAGTDGLVRSGDWPESFHRLGVRRVRIGKDGIYITLFEDDALDGGILIVTDASALPKLNTYQGYASLNDEVYRFINNK